MPEMSLSETVNITISGKVFLEFIAENKKIENINIQLTLMWQNNAMILYHSLFYGGSLKKLYFCPE